MLAIAQQGMPQAEHRVFAPTQTAFKNLCAEFAPAQESATAGIAAEPRSNAPAPILAGYSTGAFLLLRELEQRAPLFTHRPRLLLFAPFVDFRAEAGLGGRVVTTRLKLLLRRLRSDPLAALADFYHQSEIRLDPPAALPYAQADLVWGIEQLAQTSVCATVLGRLRRNETGLPITAWVGGSDALLDAQQTTALFAPGQCRIAQGASHDLASLLAAATAEGALLA